MTAPDELPELLELDVEPEEPLLVVLDVGLKTSFVL